MKNPASSIALIFPLVGLILLGAAGFMYSQSAGTPNIDPLDLWLGPAIAGGVGVIFLTIGTIMYFAFRETSSESQQAQQSQNDPNTLNQNPHDLP